MMTLDELLTSPDHYLHAFENDDLDGVAIFVQMDRAAYHRSIALDGRISRASPGSMRVPLAMLDNTDLQPRPVNWLFHIAHCGSTLLARALDHEDSNLVLREPLALWQCGVTPDAHRLALVKAMIGKRYASDAPTLVKANVPVNFILPELVEAGSETRAILLYCGWQDYLMAVLRTPDHRKWLKDVTAMSQHHIGGPPRSSSSPRWLRSTWAR